MAKVLITGPARSGTTLLLLLSHFFINCRVCSDRERHPLEPQQSEDNVRHVIIKQPYGFYEEFRPKYLFKDLLENDWRIICIIRDPRDTLISFNEKEGKIGAHWCPPKSWIRTAKELLANVWDPSLFALRYEDLVIDPDSIMSEVASFLGVGLKENFKEFYKTPLVNNWKTLNGARPIDENSIGRWKDEQHIGYLNEVITDEVKELAFKLGYQL